MIYHHLPVRASLGECFMCLQSLASGETGSHRHGSPWSVRSFGFLHDSCQPSSDVEAIVAVWTSGISLAHILIKYT